MKRRSKATGKLRRKKTTKLQQPRVSKQADARTSSVARHEGDATRLAGELNEVRARQAATAEVLKVISSLRGELTPVFDKILSHAIRLCGATFGTLSLYLGEEGFRSVATHNAPPAFAELRHRVPVIRPPVMMSVAATKQLAHILDLREQFDREHDPDSAAFVDLAGVRTVLCMPLLKDEDVIGALVIYRNVVEPFSETQISLGQNFAAQAVIAIESTRLLNELRHRTGDLTEALEKQTATSELLRVISSSSGDLGPVYAAMLENAVRICDATFGNIYRVEGDGLHIVATHNTPPVFAEARRTMPSFSPGPKNPVRHMMTTKTVVHVDDVAATEAYVDREPAAVASVELGGTRTLMIVPMLKDNELVGACMLARQEVRPFNDKQIELVTNFAAQAVIAIENARLLNELRQRTTDLTERTADLTEALEQQTSTSEVLQIISSSPGDLEPVFQAMLENATRICQAKFGVVFSFDGNEYHVEAQVGTPPELAEYINRTKPIQVLPGSLLDRVRQTKRVSYTADYAAEGIPAPPVALGGARSTVDVPMLKDGELVGAFSIYRQEVRPFTERQIALLTNFAAQAVIAIENARLLNELRQRTTDLTERTADLTEALEQQTATSEVLRVISASPGMLAPVFQAMLENATRICEAAFGSMLLREGPVYRRVALHNAPRKFSEFSSNAPTLKRGTAPSADRVIDTKRVVHILDLAAEEPDVPIAKFGGARTLLNVPLLKEDEAIGVIGIYRQDVRPFTDKQIALLTNFAAQAVIAIENARLLDELRQSLEQQTATSDVLRVISSSPGDLEPVFAAMLASATRICEAELGNLFLRDGEAFKAVAWHGEPTYVNTWRGDALIIKTDVPDIPLSRLVITKQPVHVTDLRQEATYKAGFPPLVALVDKGGARTLLIVPMLKEGALVGAIAIYRQQVRPFTDKQIALVENFADQAVIAIENARLLRELRERTEDVVQLNQQLEQRVTDQVDEIERMSRLRRFLPPQVADLIVASGTEKQLESHRREITALFCDLRGFTGFTESADAEDVMALLRDYHAAIGEIIIKYNGTLERYAGDGVMVVFNDPVPVENPALQAVLMALEVREAIGGLTETWRRWGTTSVLASALRTASPRLGLSASRAGSTMPPSAQCPTLPLACAMRRSQDKSSSAREC